MPIDGGGGGLDPNGNCIKLTCADLKINCGPAGDGCGGLIESCGTCSGKETCGGGGTPSVCGGTQGCVPRTCQQLGIECGPAGDGCGGTLACGDCEGNAICGGGGPSKCGGGQVQPDGGILLPDGGVCVPGTAATLCAGKCGPVADGCGGLVTCAGCPTGQTCGGGGVPSKCGSPACTKTTCTAQGANCGFVADGCGGVLNCGGTTCPAGQICGGAGPNRCGAGNGGGDAGACVNYCQDQLKNDTCAANAKTKIRGKIYAPNGTLPIPGARIYIPNGSKAWPHGVPTFRDGVAGGTCEQCNETIADALVDTTSAADGSFTLDNVPPETAFPLVIQLGRWRRMVTIPARTRCSNTTLSADQTRLPRRQNETQVSGVSRDNIPLVGISTGRVDGLECVFRKLGIEDSQFTNPNGINPSGGRIRLHQDNDYNNSDPDARGGARINGNTPLTDQSLTDSQAHLDQYDAVIFGCPGGEHYRNDAINDRVRAYADKGGRVFATHYNYVYIDNNDNWNNTVNWNINGGGSGNVSNNNSAVWTGQVNTGSGQPTDKRFVFSQWLAAPGVTALSGTSPPRIAITEARNNADRNVSNGAEEWITYHSNQSNQPAPGGTPVLHYTFNTPWGATPARQCGRVLFSDFHVTVGNTEDFTFPTECSEGGLTAQEKVLAFFLFDLTSCIQPSEPPPPPTCTPRTCAQQGIQCGGAGNGCGAQLNCGTCAANQVCQGNPARCVPINCTKTSCSAQGADCGRIPDGCGGALSCGDCTNNQKCGGSGPNQCGNATCNPKTCQQQGIQCGPAGDTCGALIDCGPCPAGQTCGGGGTPGVCGAPNCTKRTCEQANANCGFVADGCGGALDCGPCPPGQTCGGGGVPNQCGAITVPK